MRTINVGLIICLPLLLSISCKKFLQVNADNQVLQEKLFENGEGVHIAVNGVYKLLSVPELYGKNLSWGFVSGLGYNYEAGYLPYEMQDAVNFNWESANTRAITEQVWQKAFNVLANCNNIIREVQTKDSSFFAYGSNEKNMILGEMYGIRAMLHFDLLRIFSPAPVTGYSGATIPYVSNYPEYQPAPVDMATIFTKITGDMEQARTLLGPVDTGFIVLPNSGAPLIRYPAGRIRNFGGSSDIPQGDFFNFRGQRMNYFGATALLARIQMYKGDYANAYNNAKIVYDIQKKGWYQWTRSTYQGQVTNVDNIYTKRPDELVLSFSNGKNYDNYEQVLLSGGAGTQYFRMNSTYISKLFEGDLDDYRVVGWYNRYNDQRYLTWARPRGTSSQAEQVLKVQGPILPVVRFSEMYHILIECNLRQNKVVDGVNMLNDLRTNRGAKKKIATTVTSNELMEILVKDIIRETLTEGQTFFLFKRLNRNIYNGNADRLMNSKDWYSPLPLSEIAYQL